MTGTRHLRVRTVLVALGVLAATAMSGCTGEEAGGSQSTAAATLLPTPVFSAPAPSPTPSGGVSIPANLSPQEAQAAAKAIKAYEEYVWVTDQVFQSGGKQAGSLDRVAQSTALIAARNEAAYLAENELVGLGETRIHNLIVRSVNMTVDPSKRVVPETIIDSCEDVSGTKLLHSTGRPARPSNAPLYWATTTWVRYYPDQSAGVEGWVVADRSNKGVAECSR